MTDAYGFPHCTHYRAEFRLINGGALCLGATFFVTDEAIRSVTEYHVVRIMCNELLDGLWRDDHLRARVTRIEVELTPGVWVERRWPVPPKPMSLQQPTASLPHPPEVWP